MTDTYIELLQQMTDAELDDEMEMLYGLQEMPADEWKRRVGAVLMEMSNRCAHDEQETLRLLVFSVGCWAYARYRDTH